MPDFHDSEFADLMRQMQHDGLAEFNLSVKRLGCGLRNWAYLAVTNGKTHY